jgi:hypothetical protein
MSKRATWSEFVQWVAEVHCYTEQMRRLLRAAPSVSTECEAAVAIVASGFDGDAPETLKREWLEDLRRRCIDAPGRTLAGQIEVELRALFAYRSKWVAALEAEERRSR